jgi:hypothetical protein
MEEKDSGHGDEAEVSNTTSHVGFILLASIPTKRAMQK